MAGFARHAVSRSKSLAANQFFFDLPQRAQRTQSQRKERRKLVESRDFATIINPK